jgi:hypothetical protein
MIDRSGYDIEGVGETIANGPAKVGPGGRATASKGKKDAPQPFAFVLSDDIDFDLESEDLIDGTLPRIGVVMFFAKPQTFKSFVALDWNFHIVKGEPWGGRRVEKGGAIYIASEGSGGLKKRKVGYARTRGIPKGAQFVLIPAAPDLGSKNGDLDRLIMTIEATGISPAIVTIDTANKSMGAAEENGAGMQMLVNNSVALSLRFQCCVVIIHHVGVGEAAGADKRPRGFSGSTGGVEAQILCEREEGALAATLTVQKQKDDQSGICFDVMLEKIELGTNKRGKVHSTLVVTNVVEVGAVKKPKIVPKSSETGALQIALLEAYDELAGGVAISNGLNGASVRKVAVSKLRDELKTRGLLGIDDSGALTDNARAKFSRAKTTLLSANRLAERERLIWRISDQ